MEMLTMFVLVVTEDKGIVILQEDKTKMAMHLVYEPLECLSCNSQAKRPSKSVYGPNKVMLRRCDNTPRKIFRSIGF